jgi:hypothetical protein
MTLMSVSKDPIGAQANMASCTWSIHDL